MRAEKCLFCESRKIDYRNGLLSTKVPGLQVEFGLCRDHKWRQPMAWLLIGRSIKKMETKMETLLNKGKKFPLEPCLLCNGTGEIGDHKDYKECWWCHGVGKVQPLFKSRRTQERSGNA